MTLTDFLNDTGENTLESRASLDSLPSLTGLFSDMATVPSSRATRVSVNTSSYTAYVDRIAELESRIAELESRLNDQETSSAAYQSEANARLHDIEQALRFLPTS